MADRLELLLEADRRGLAIDEADRALLAEARRRGLVQGEGQQASVMGAVRNRLSEAAALPGRVASAVMERAADPTQRLLPNPIDLIPKPSLRVALPLVAGGNPLVQAAVGAGSEALAQGREISQGERERVDPLSVGIAGAIPPAVTGAIRVGRALGRTATRAVPSLFSRAQEAARGAAEDIGAALTPETSAGQLFKAARGTGETVPPERLTAILDDLDTTIPKEPTNAGLQQVRAFIEKFRGMLKDPTTGAQVAPTVDDLLRQRLDLGREIARPGSAPELRALYGHGGKDAKGIIGALEAGAEAGGASAAVAREALSVFKRDLGVLRWKELVEQATRRTSISGVDTPAINIAKLGDLVAKNADELSGQLGPEGLALIRGYLTRFRSLPPTHAATAASALLGLMAGAGAGFTTGSIPAAVGAVLAPEIARNIFAVGRNPTLVNQVMIGLAQATRAATQFNPPRVLMNAPDQFRTPLTGLRISGAE